MAETYLLATRCPVYRRHDSHLGSRTELENLSGDAKGKGTSSETVRPKVPMRRVGADCSVIARKRMMPRRDRHDRILPLTFKSSDSKHILWGLW